LDYLKTLLTIDSEYISNENTVVDNK